MVDQAISQWRGSTSGLNVSVVYDDAVPDCPSRAEMNKPCLTRDGTSAIAILNRKAVKARRGVLGYVNLGLCQGQGCSLQSGPEGRVFSDLDIVIPHTPGGRFYWWSDYDLAPPTWDTEAIDLRSVILHEFGHFFGLGHSLENSVMFPVLPAGVRRATLQPDDVAGIQGLYQGPRTLVRRPLSLGMRRSEYLLPGQTSWLQVDLPLSLPAIRMKVSGKFGEVLVGRPDGSKFYLRSGEPRTELFPLQGVWSLDLTNPTGAAFGRVFKLSVVSTKP